VGGPDLLDVILVLIAIGYGMSGFRNGAVVGALSFIGFFGGAAIGAQLAKPLGDRVADGSAQVPVAIVCVLVVAMAGQLLAVWIGSRIRAHVSSRPLRKVDSVVGAILSVMAVLLVAWMIAVPVASSPFPTLAGQVRRSMVIRSVDDALPDRVRQLYSSLRLFIDRSGFPEVLGALQPTRIVDVAPTDPTLQNSPIVGKVHPSVLRVQAVALSCDRSIEGSSFAYAPDHVLTNAHVVAGTNEVHVETDHGTLTAHVVVYDPQRDVAVLYVPGLNETALTMNATTAKSGSNAIVLGYPQDGPFDARSARIRDSERINGKDIYGRGNVEREIYTIRSIVRVGNSGGPLIDTRGAVLGIVFASALDSADTGFVLTTKEVAPDAAAGRNATKQVATGQCTSG
jgi:S1-C subfamily serine protease